MCHLLFSTRLKCTKMKITVKNDLTNFLLPRRNIIKFFIISVHFHVGFIWENNLLSQFLISSLDLSINQLIDITWPSNQSIHQFSNIDSGYNFHFYLKFIERCILLLYSYMNFVVCSVSEIGGRESTFIMT